ncbi:flavin monoamine oxidase family protein [Salinibius halmophilus]|uniref:flavin monoamine oxidase family protein n=1 Tax=Salinibius halmophilus TaxID=1853216 RepID=UPI000E673EEB|nr:FAD-dependent oxidoreductase [Salinibius halmophilus]
MISIVGGGLSGLYTAYLLQQKGLAFQLFEARERFGGRIKGLPVGDSSHLELGPSWFWPHQARMQQLCAELNLPYFEQYVAGDALYQLPGRPMQRFQGAGTMTSYRLAGGLTKLDAALVEQLPRHALHANAPVAHVQYQQGWQLTVNGVTHNSDALILAAPPRALINKTNLAEQLSPKLVDRLASTPTWMAAQAKFVAHYSQPFWRQAGLAGDAFSRTGPMVEIHDASAHEQAGFALFGFIGLDAQQRKSIAPKQLEQACLKQFADLFGPQALQPTTFALQDWQHSPYTCTQADINQATEHPNCPVHEFTDELASLNLYFAGSEMANEEAGYLEGALAAAEGVVLRI